VTRILVVAASPVVRAGLDAVLAANPALEVVGRASATTTLAPQVAALQPDVVVVELEGHDDPAATAMFGDVLSAAATVVLADDPRGTWAAEALRAGARAILPREATADEIVGAVEAAAAGLVVLHPAVAATLLPLLPTPARAVPAPPAQSLTPREIEVLGMLAEGLGNKTIARRLGISEHTVKFHVGSILAKLDASSRTEAVTLGARRGLIML
jgi:two-component system, NarL family, response regulator YdfI